MTTSRQYLIINFKPIEQLKRQPFYLRFLSLPLGAKTILRDAVLVWLESNPNALTELLSAPLDDRSEIYDLIAAKLLSMKKPLIVGGIHYFIDDDGLIFS